jgi:DNA-binding transcriptional MerR regulator
MGNMKTTLKFTCDDVEESNSDLQLILKARDMWVALHDIKDLLRNWDKNGIPEHITSHLAMGEDGSSDTVEKLRALIEEIIYERVGRYNGQQ